MNEESLTRQLFQPLNAKSLALELNAFKHGTAVQSPSNITLIIRMLNRISAAVENDLK
jgi:hypothetical protein